jgi:uncharacterized repeat protein (TIGR01451 family)
MSLVGSISHWRITDWLDNPAQHTFTATVSDLDPGESVYVQYYTEMEGGGPIPGGRVFTNTLQVQQLPEDNNPANNQASITLFSGPDLYIQKEINPGTYMPGGSITYGLHIGNRSNTMSYSMQGSTRITDTLPAGLIYTGSSWGPPSVDGQTIVWDVGTIWAGWDNWIWVYAQISSDVPIGSVITNSAVIQSSSPADIDINPVNNTGQVSFQIVSPAYQLSKTAQGNLVAGTVLTYTLSVTNTGNLAGTNIQVYDPLPAGLTYYGSDGWFDGSGALYWTLSQLDPGQTAHTWVAGTLSCSAGQVVTNQNYQVTSSDQGVNSPVGPAHTITITAPALEASFTASPESDLMPGAQVGFTDQSTTNGAPIVSWQWDFGDGSPLEPERSPNHIFQNAGAYTVTLTITDPCGFTAAHQQMLVVTDLSIGNQDGYSQLSWTHLGPAVDHYEVWASTLPYFTPGDAGSTKLGELYGPFDPALDYADPLATIGDVEVNHFYVMRAVFGPGQPSALSNRVGELDYLLEETNSSDLNWIALSLDVGLAKSSDLITHIQNNSSGTITVASVEKWNVVAQNYQVYTAGGTDFDLQTGGIYRVAISGTGGAPRVWSLFGKVPPAAVFAYNLRETATSDMNWIMLPLDKYLIVDAAGLAADILAYSNPGTTVFTVETWNTTAQNYLVYSDTGSGFTVRFGYPYRITIDVATGDSSTWPAR